MKLGYSLPEIRDHFDFLFARKEQEKKGVHHVPIDRQLKELEIFEVPLDLPRYRLSNTRTIAKQAEYIAENNLDENYFESNQLSDSLQLIQHGFLKEMISRRGLKEYFSDSDNIQTTPLILTHDGFVVSGNRRLCAFRELYHESDHSENRYSHLKRVRVIILPLLDEEDIEYIEDYFEQQPDIRDEFTWTNRALGFDRRMKRHNYTIDKLAAKTNVKKKEIESLIFKLQLAKEYLEFIGRPNSFAIVENDEFAFNQLLKTRQKFEQKPLKKDAFQKISFILLKNQESVSGRMYNNIPIVQSAFQEIEEEILSDIENPKSENDFEDPFDGFDESSDSDLSLLEIIDDSTNEEAILEIVLDKIEDKKASNEERKRKKAVLRKVQKANKELIDAVNFFNEETDLTGILDQLKNIEGNIRTLKKMIEE